jgi:hypothetical protein
MYRYLIVLLLSWSAHAHEFTPTYPKLEHSYVPGILKVEMQLFNRREDVSYYQLSVLDEAKNPLVFGASNKIVQIPYLGKKTIEIFIRHADKDKAVYVCSKSKFPKVKGSAISSKICSKIVK